MPIFLFKGGAEWGVGVVKIGGADFSVLKAARNGGRVGGDKASGKVVKISVADFC